MGEVDCLFSSNAPATIVRHKAHITMLSHQEVNGFAKPPFTYRHSPSGSNNEIKIHHIHDLLYIYIYLRSLYYHISVSSPFGGEPVALSAGPIEVGW